MSRAGGAAAALLVILLGATRARAGDTFTHWVTRGCEPPSVYYSPGHVPGAPPCCPQLLNLCAGGSACPVTGRCGDGRPCTPGSLADRPNIALVISDDQAYCDYGFMGVCRSSRSGAPLPAPHTPALDQLGTAGKIFPVAHDAAAWCFPSLQTILTGRLPSQRGGGSQPPGSLPPNVPIGSSPETRTLPQLLSHNAATGGGLYCSYQTGKLGTPGGVTLGFDARFQSHTIGRTPCTRCGADKYAAVPANCPEEPKCGEAIGPAGNRNTGDIQTFFDDLLIGPRDGAGRVIKGQRYTQPQPFFLWYAPRLPHVPTTPPAVVEVRPHVALEASNDFLFGSTPLGGSTPRFPFGATRYATLFREPMMAGRYGNVWWADSTVTRIEDLLAARRISDATCDAGVCSDAPNRLCTVDADCSSMAAHTVVVYITDNGTFLPRSKHHFTENGYRTALVIYDPRHTQNAGPNRIETEAGHGKDVMPTLLALAGHPEPGGLGLPGADLSGWIDGSRTTPVRNGICGPEVRDAAMPNRYIRTRPGVIGRCSPRGGQACADDKGCPAGTLCSEAGRCAAPGTALCAGDGDCAASDFCAFVTRKWCRFGTSLDDPITACTSDDACRALPACAANGSGDPVVCTCEYRALKLYANVSGRRSLTDLFVDPDEEALGRGGAAGGASGSVVDRLQCCLDQWWTPGGQGACGGGCDPALSCS